MLVIIDFKTDVMIKSFNSDNFARLLSYTNLWGHSSLSKSKALEVVIFFPIHSLPQIYAVFPLSGTNC